ncbi:MAG: peptide-methionine (R)-S-oxide reductase MsrB [Woeseia sp.]
MNRRQVLTTAILACGAAACGPIGRAQSDSATASKNFPPVNISRDEWRNILDEDRFRILFRAGTEPAFSSPLDKQYDPGTYICAACFLPLFESADKFDSRTGWPSFTKPIAGHVETKADYLLIIPRTEYHCARCGGHQGHVFDDGPAPTGKRYCNNGLALLFVAENEVLPDLRRAS